MSTGGLGMRRTRGERLAAWLVTGPLGHLVGFAADVSALWLRWFAGKARERLATRVRGRRAAREGAGR